MALSMKPFDIILHGMFLFKLNYPHLVLHLAYADNGNVLSKQVMNQQPVM